MLVAFIIFGRRVQKTVYGKAEGQAGAAAWALDNMQGTWRVTNAVAGTTQLDAVHRVIGRPGVILVAEGSPQRREVAAGPGEEEDGAPRRRYPDLRHRHRQRRGPGPASQLQKYLNKLPKNIDTKRMDAIESRLAALSSRGGGAALPKGPMPGGAKMRGVQRTIRRR